MVVNELQRKTTIRIQEMLHQSIAGNWSVLERQMKVGSSRNLLIRMVGACGFEPQTLTVAIPVQIL
jgi:hypothetical protein